jgi:hypothetical protein
VNGVLDDEVKSQEGAAWAQAKVDTAKALPMAREFVADSVTGGLLQHAMQLPPPSRDAVLDRLGVVSGNLRGLEALKATGLLNKDGVITIPPPGSAEYVRYSDFVSNAPGLAGAVNDATTNVADKFTDCMTDALVVKTAGKS